eukprot:gene16217-22062_t
MAKLPSNEILALSDFYNSTDGDYWVWYLPYEKFGYPWNFTKDLDGNYEYDPCSAVYEWQGIDCALIQNQHHVVVLNLRLRLLHGTLPPTLTFLSELRILNVTENLLSGTIPYQYANFTHMEIIDIYHNHFTGPFPVFLFKLNSLRIIQIDYNHFAGTLPNELYSSFPALEAFDGGNNYFHGSINLISNITMKNFTYFTVQHNIMSGSILSWSFESLRSMKSFGLNYNIFTGPIPSSMCKMENLQILYLDHALFTGSLPSCFSNFTMLTGVAVDANMLTGTVPSNWNNSMLTEIYLNNNYFSGSFPDYFLSNSKDLHIFDVSANYFTGIISDKINNLNFLEQFYIQDNILSGSFLESLVSLQDLQYLNCSLNFFSGSVTSNFSNAHILAEFDVSSNLLHGRLPNTSHLYRLEIIFVGNNYFSGDIQAVVDPVNTRQLRLRHIDVSSNELTGAIPEDIFNLRFLITFSA